MNLFNILADHALWLKTDGKEGTRADLTRANLTEAYLSGADLTGVNLSYTYINTFLSEDTPTISSITLQIKDDFSKPVCNHKWKKYNGFMENYDFCEHCDARKS